MHKFPYNWTLKDAVFTKDKGKVFSCFACGGGSTMGYKLAGFDVIGFNEIDPKMAACYVENHKPKYAFLEPIQTFKSRPDLPAELYDLDILDGSPPCSSFSMAGNREQDWGKKKQFREGQAKQVLDTLFFDFIDLGERLQPKVIIAENVKGLILGNAKSYVKRIAQAFDKAGYYCKLYLFDASKMGVPQKRERVFFICVRKDLLDKCTQIPKDKNGAHLLEFGFNEPTINFKAATFGYWQQEALMFDNNCLGREWDKLKEGESSSKYFQLVRIKSDNVCPTITTGCGTRSTASISHPIRRGKFNNNELCACSTYPQDYTFGKSAAGYLIGMSVPPVMTAQIATKVHEQILSKL